MRDALVRPRLTRDALLELAPLKSGIVYLKQIHRIFL